MAQGQKAHRSPDMSTFVCSIREAAPRSILIAVPLKGFQKIREVRRPLGELRTPNPGNARGQVFEVLQVVYSDGLTGLSVFIEPVSEQRARREGVAALGATQVVVRRVADFWITVVGEVPASTVRQFATAVEYRPPKTVH